MCSKMHFFQAFVTNPIPKDKLKHTAYRQISFYKILNSEWGGLESRIQKSET